MYGLEGSSAEKTLKLSEFRAKGKLTQSDFARLIGRTQPTIQRWEAGKHLPGRRDIERIAEVTEGQVTPNDFHQIAASEASAHA